MVKRLTDILKTQPKGSSYNLGEKGGFQPHAGETAAKAFLAKHQVEDHGEPFEVDHLGGVKEFDRGANRFGHDNVEYNKFNNKGGLKPADIPTEEVDQEDIEILGELMDVYFEENPEASFEEAYQDIIEDLNEVQYITRAKDGKKVPLDKENQKQMDNAHKAFKQGMKPKKSK